MGSITHLMSISQACVIISALTVTDKPVSKKHISWSYQEYYDSDGDHFTML